MAKPRTSSLALVVAAVLAAYGSSESVPTCGVEGGACANLQNGDDPALLQINDIQTVRDRKAGAKVGTHSRGVYTIGLNDFAVETNEEGSIYKLHVDLPQHGENTQWPEKLRLYVTNLLPPTPEGYIQANSIVTKNFTYDGIVLPGYLVTYADGARCMAVDPYMYTSPLCQDWFLIAPPPTVTPVPNTTMAPTTGPPEPTPAPTPEPTSLGRCCFHMTECPSDLAEDNEVAGCVETTNFCSASAERCTTPQNQPDGCDGTNTGTANVFCKV